MALTATAIPAQTRAMKTRTMLVTLALCLATATTCFAASPQMGTWKLNEAKSKIGPGMGRNTKVIYAADISLTNAIGQLVKDRVKVTVEGVDKDGTPTHSVWVGKFDGKVYSVKGNLPYNAMVYKVVNDYTNNIMAMKDGKTMWTGTVTVAKDGKSRTVIVNGTDAKGKKFTNNVVYDKQ